MDTDNGRFPRPVACRGDGGGPAADATGTGRKGTTNPGCSSKPWPPQAMEKACKRLKDKGRESRGPTRRFIPQFAGGGVFEALVTEARKAARKFFFLLKRPTGEFLVYKRLFV